MSGMHSLPPDARATLAYKVQKEQSALVEQANERDALIVSRRQGHPN